MKKFYHKLKKLILDTLRNRLILSVAIVYSILMALFIWGLSERQKQLSYEFQTQQAETLALTIATSATLWLEPLNTKGLQQIVTAQANYPELLFAIILNHEGRILAHTNHSRVGQIIANFPQRPTGKILAQNPELIDVISPITIKNKTVGWVHIGLGQKTSTAYLNTFIRDGVIFALIVIFLGSLLAWYSGTHLTKKLRTIRLTADAVQRGNTQYRSAVKGNDEVSHVAKAFNNMLDHLESSRIELEKSEERFDLAMLASNDGLWDWDLVTNDVYFSPQWKSILGYQEHELENAFATWDRLTHDEDKVIHLEQVDQCIAKKQSGFVSEFRMKHKQGQWVHIFSQATLVLDKNNQPVRMVGTHTDITDKKEKDKVIWNQANYDELTLLPNRKFFQELLKQEIKQAQRDKEQLWILFLDLDGFKEVNDTLGHHVGDALLIKVAERITATLRKADVVARLGGDEFVIILPHIAETSTVDRVASKLIDSISQSYELLNDKVFTSVSIGIANYPNDADNVNDLLKFADQSMYVAKKEGKNRYSYFTASLQQESLKRIQISNDLRQGLLKDEFQLYYQPIIDLHNNEVHKAEALIRWQHPEKGLISPAAFIPVAEETGSIIDIGTWVFEQAFKQLNEWQSWVGSSFQLSVNMSPSQLKIHDKKYDNWLLKLNEYNISGHNIVIEITEGLLLKSDKFVTDRLLQYRDAGIQVAIDDFGTGYSSLSYLKEFDIDYLKIDQSFTRNLKPGSRELSISEAIIAMAHTLDLRVIAEGIETQEQCDLLIAMGCDYGQGYLFSRPLPAQEFTRTFIKNSTPIN